MKLLFIRHGDPDYEIDSLTEKGWKEAALLAERVSQLEVKTFYVSPLGRARDTASLTLQKMNREEIEGMLIDNSDEPYAAEIARAIAGRNRKGQKIDTTTKLAELIGETLAFLPEKERKEAVKKSCARVFQALRIDVNSEFEVLEAFLTKLPSCMAPGGRIAILTFHSGEDRLVKRAFKEGKKAGIYSEVAEDVIRPSSEECAKNPRAKSTKMRWAVRAEE